MSEHMRWVMPEWMKPFEKFFQDRGTFGVEATMNCYGAKCASRLIEASKDPNTPRTCKP